MLKLESVAAFVSILETGSIAGAARRLEISKSVVSERLTDLERILGAKLIRRTTRKLSATPDGHAFYGRAKQILRDVEEAAAEVANRRETLAGPLRISAPVGFGSLHLGPALFGVLARFPGLELTLELDDRFVDVIAEGYDAVIRHGPVDDRRLIVKRLAASKRALVASPDYFEAPWATERAAGAHAPSGHHLLPPWRVRLAFSGSREVGDRAPEGSPACQQRPADARRRHRWPWNCLVGNFLSQGSAA